MKFREFGEKDLPAIILLHGGGVSWWSLQKIIDALQQDYRVITPIIDGHGEDFQQTFVSIEDSARKLLEYIDRKLDGKVLAVGGLSLGAQIVAELLSLRSNIADYAIIESALVYPIKGVNALTVPMYKLCYGLIRKKWFSRLQAKQLYLPEDMFEYYYEDSVKISRQTLINVALSNGNYTLKSSIGDTRSKVLILVGEKELNIMKKSAHALHELIHGSDLRILPKMVHGEFSLGHPSEFINTVKSFIRQ